MYGGEYFSTALVEAFEGGCEELEIDTELDESEGNEVNRIPSSTGKQCDQTYFGEVHAHTRCRSPVNIEPYNHILEQLCPQQ